VTGSIPPSRAVSASPAPPWLERWIYPLIVGLALAVYWPVYRAGFIWDDPAHVTAPALRSLHGLWRIWTDLHATQQYYPLLHSAFWIEHHLWGDAALGYHGLNVVLHAAVACSFVAVLRRLSVPGAALAGLLFALHPLAVETAAWVAEQKNTLSTLFYLGAFLVYLEFDASRRARDYGLASALFVCALLSKSMTATLPAALLVVFWWKRGPLCARDWKPLLPWFALAAAMAVVTSTVERVLIGAQGKDFDLTVFERVLLAGKIIWFYLGKILCPVGLKFIYPRWSISAAEPTLYLYSGSLVVLLAVLWRGRTKARAPLAAALLFMGSAFPALGFINVYPFVFSFVADHWAYLPSLPVIAFVAAGWQRLRERGASAFSSRLWAAGATAVVALLAAMSARQTVMYRDLETFYRTIIVQNPASFMPYNNLAVELATAGRPAEAIPLFEKSLEFRPEAGTFDSLGNALLAAGRPTEAIARFQQALVARPEFTAARVHLAAALEREGRRAEAIAEYQRVLQQNPGLAEAHNDLAALLAAGGRLEEAVEHYRRAVDLRPDFAGAWSNLGNGLIQLGRAREAVPALESAVRLQPGESIPHGVLGIALAETGDAAAALRQFQQAADLDPNSADAQANLGRGLLLLGRKQEAEAHFRMAERLSGGRR
jgi:tetratricopeptide (TPR) repeat protein